MMNSTAPINMKITVGIWGNVACNAKIIPIGATSNIAAMISPCSNIRSERMAKSRICIHPPLEPLNALHDAPSSLRLYVLAVSRNVNGPMLIDFAHCGAATGGTYTNTILNATRNTATSNAFSPIRIHPHAISSS